MRERGFFYRNGGTLIVYLFGIEISDNGDPFYRIVN
jgi:hypothetical protein